MYLNVYVLLGGWLDIVMVKRENVSILYLKDKWNVFDINFVKYRKLEVMMISKCKRLMYKDIDIDRNK